MKFTTTGKVKFIVGYVQDFPSAINHSTDKTKKIRFYLEDTGNGIPEAKMTDIFLPFYQLDPPQSSQEGTGLGLTISQNLVEQMGSTIQVQSRLTEGSIFWFDLDLAAIDRDRDPASFAGQIEPDIAGYTGRKRQILVVDDLDNNREVLVNFLSPLGFDVLEANSSIKAIALTQEYQPDLIILDLVMPNMDGWEVTQRLRQESKFSELPVIIVSASIFPTDQSNCYQAGANHFLTKPLDFAELLRVMEQYLELEWINIQGSQQCLQPASRSQLSQNSLVFASQVSSEKTPATPMVIPSTDELNQLLTCVMQGDIRGTLSLIEQLQQNEPQLVPFTQEIIHLAQTCQLRKLKELIKQALDI